MGLEKPPHMPVLVLFALICIARFYRKKQPSGLNILISTPASVGDVMEAETSNLRWTLTLNVYPECSSILHQKPRHEVSIKIIYSKIYLKRTCSEADICLKQTKDFSKKYYFSDQSIIKRTCLKRTKKFVSKCPLQTGFTVYA